eukprot:jgi/Tetstr1/424597/TSEL_015122.t1
MNATERRQFPHGCAFPHMTAACAPPSRLSGATAAATFMPRTRPAPRQQAHRRDHNPVALIAAAGLASRCDTEGKGVAALVLAHHAQFDWIHVATALSRLGKLWVKRAVPAAELGATHEAAALLRARIVRAAAAGERVPPRVLANAVHGLAKIWLADAEFLHAISGQVAAAAPALLPAELAMLVWAYGRSRVADDAALRALAERAGALVGRLTPHSLATVAAAFADVQRAPPALFQALSCEVVRRGKAVDIVSMAKLVRGYARLGLREEPHLQMHQFVAGQLEARINEANLYDVRMLLGGWATLGFHHKGAVAALRGHVATWLEEVTSEQVAPLLWGLAQLDTAWDSEPMAQGSAGVCLGRSEHALRDGLQGLLALHAHALPAEDLSIAALAMAILDDSAAGRAVLATHVAPFVRSYQGSFTREQYERLFQVELIHGSTEEDPVLLAQPGYGIGQRLWLEAVAEGPPEEELGLCGEVHRVLRGLGLDVEMQWRTDDGLLPVDIMLFLDAQVRPVPLQVDGRSRLSFPAPHRLLGEARAHDRMLRSRCPEVLRVPFHEWAALGCLEDQRAYLLRKVQSLRQ